MAPQPNSNPARTPAPRPAGILLTGGASRRMGRDKATIEIASTTLARRTAFLLRRVSDPVLEVGPGHTGLRTVAEAAPGAGPLAALADAAGELARAGHHGPALLLATDLPRLNIDTLRRLAQWPGEGSVLPTLRGRPQPLCARWSAAELAAAVELAAGGARAMRALFGRPGITLVEWPDPVALEDVDTPEQLARFTALTHPRPDGA